MWWDDAAQFLTAAEASALVAATPWPYNVYVHMTAWAGLRVAELAGLQAGDVELPAPPLNPRVARPEGNSALLGAPLLVSLRARA